MAVALLSSLVSGSEESANVLIEDCTEHCGQPLLRSILCQTAKKHEYVHVLLTDLPKEVWLKDLPQFTMKNIIVNDDCLTDPLGWNSESCKLSNEMIDLFDFPEPMATGSSVALIVDNISSLLIHYQYTHLCSTIKKLGQKYSSSYFLIHQDLHDDHVIRGLHHMMSSTIRMLPRKQEKHLLSLIYHKRKSGKILKEVNRYYTDDKGNVFCHKYDDTNKLEGQAEQVGIDPTASLTFDLRLTDRQKQERSRVVLPYTLIDKSGDTPSKGTGSVTYQLDEVDDWDESDPDDDLDI